MLTVCMEKWLPLLKEPSYAGPTSLADVTYQGNRIARPTESLTTLFVMRSI